jgi:hypothetical protein
MDEIKIEEMGEFICDTCVEPKICYRLPYFRPHTTHNFGILCFDCLEKFKNNLWNYTIEFVRETNRIKSDIILNKHDDKKGN